MTHAQLVGHAYRLCKRSGPSNLNMRKQVILDSLFARPGSTPIGGGKKREFRDWTNLSIAGGPLQLNHPEKSATASL